MRWNVHSRGELGEGNADVHGQMRQRSCGLTIFKLQRWEHMNEDFCWATEKMGAHRAWLASPFSVPLSQTRLRRRCSLDTRDGRAESAWHGAPGQRLASGLCSRLA